MAAAETDRDRDAVIARALYEYADRLDAVPLDCTALTGPVWYGQGWRDAVNHLRDLADGLMPAPTRPALTCTDTAPATSQEADMQDTSATVTGPHKPEIKPPYVLKFAQPDPTELRRELLDQWDDLAKRRRAAFGALHATGERGAKPDRGDLDRFEGLAIAGDFSFLLAAVLRRAEQYRAMDAAAEPEPFADWLARTVGLVLDSGLDWLEGANDDLDGEGDGPVVQPGSEAPSAVTA